MAAPTRPVQPKSAVDLTRWLAREVSPRLEEETEAIAHGGTALTLLGIKPSTKDMDFGFRTREALDRFSQALQALGFTATADLRPIPAEVYHRFENPSSPVDVVDLRFPTWNSWRLTGAILGRAVVLPLGKVRLVRPNRDAVFLFKTYPLRDTDLDDLRSVIDVDPPDEGRVIALFDDQDELHRRNLLEEDVALEPLFLLLHLRTRFAASVELLGPRYRAKIPRIARHARRKFSELRLAWSLSRLIKEMRGEERPLSWDRILGNRTEPLRRRLARERPTPENRFGRAPPTGH